MPAFLHTFRNRWHCNCSNSKLLFFFLVFKKIRFTQKTHFTQGSCAVLQSLIKSYIYFRKIRRLIKSYIFSKGLIFFWQVLYFFELSYIFWQVLFWLCLISLPKLYLNTLYMSQQTLRFAYADSFSLRIVLDTLYSYTQHALWLQSSFGKM